MNSGVYEKRIEHIQQMCQWSLVKTDLVRTNQEEQDGGSEDG